RLFSWGCLLGWFARLVGSWPRWIRTIIPRSKVWCPAVGRGASDVAAPQLSASHDPVEGASVQGTVSRRRECAACRATTRNPSLLASARTFQRLLRSALR